MHDSVMNYAAQKLHYELCHNALVLEVGSLDVNGSVRPLVTLNGPRGYIGIDMQAGPGVDIQTTLSLAHRTLFRPEAFDIVICTEMLEHSKNWANDLYCMVNLLDYSAPDAPSALLLTTRSPGFPYHGFPHDYNRFTVEAMREIMTIMMIDGEVVSDPEAPGVFAFGQRLPRSQRTGPVDRSEIVSALLNVKGVTAP